MLEQINDNMIEIFIGLIALAGFLSYINKKFLKLPETIGIMILSIVVSLMFASSYFIDESYFVTVTENVRQIDFKTILFDFLLGILLFAGSIHVNLQSLVNEKGSVLIYATFGVVISTFLIGTVFYFVANTIGLPIDYTYCLVFGALISPTDPVAVLSILRKAGAPKPIETKIVGESLFNDGVGIVVFLSLLSLATMMKDFEILHITKEFLIETGGGAIMGLLLGYLGKMGIYQVLKEPVIAVHISLAVVLGGYSLASFLHISGPIAMVMAGLFIGHSLHSNNITKDLKDHINIFWKILDDIFNAILFVLIGIEIIALQFNIFHLLLGIISIFIVLLSRYATIYLSNSILKRENRTRNKERLILTWAGLRGGISIALALSLPNGEVKDIILYVTYVIVVFSIIVQGLTLKNLIVELNKK